MAIQRGDIVLRKAGAGWSEDHYRVEMVIGDTGRVRNLTTFSMAKVPVKDLAFLYHTDGFDAGDIVRIRDRYREVYTKVNTSHDLTVVQTTANVTVSTVKVENVDGGKFDILNERLFLVRPAKAFKAGDRVVVDFDLARKFGYDGISGHYTNTGVMVLMEDSGSRQVQYTSHVRYTNRDGREQTNNVPTRWLKLYEEPAKRVVGETIKVADIKVGDKVSVVQTLHGIEHLMTGVVGDKPQYFGDDSTSIVSTGGGVFPYESKGAVYTLLEEAPEPVDENLQRLLDAGIGDIAHGTYADEYWKKVGEDQWRLLELDSELAMRTTEHVFNTFYKLKYGTLEIYKKVDDAN